MDTQSQLLSDVETFLKAQQMAATKFGLLAVNDGKLVSRLRSGANMTLTTVDRVLAFIKSYPASDAA